MLRKLHNNTNEYHVHLNSIQSFNNYHNDEDDLIPQTNNLKVPLSKIPIQIIQTKRQLHLTIIESNFLSEGNVLHINPGGLIGSERNAQDGITIFGVNNNLVNDFNFPEEESNMGIKHFEIKYDITSDDYKIKNIQGSGLFIKITDKTLLRNNAIFSFSSTFISTKISLDQKITYNAKLNDSNSSNDFVNSILTLKVIQGINEHKEITFESKNQQVIKLGRFKSANIDMDFKDENISRLQTTIYYEGNNWYIIDGNGTNPSSNGTWYFADEYISITEGMILRTGSTSFKAHLYTNEMN